MMKRIVILGANSFIASSNIKNINKSKFKIVLIDRQKCNFEKVYC